MLKDFINQLKTSADHRDILTHYHYFPEQAAEYGPDDTGLPPEFLSFPSCTWERKYLPSLAWQGLPPGYV
ncbi:MAG TPA: hypothetical protein VIN67_01635 [Desulfobaccales bacterium]